jgi:hypothetical protein
MKEKVLRYYRVDPKTGTQLGLANGEDIVAFTDYPSKWKHNWLKTEMVRVSDYLVGCRIEYIDGTPLEDNQTPSD